MAHGHGHEHSNLVYVFMALTQPANLTVVTSCVVAEQFGYGFGFTAYMLYMIYLSQGKYQTALIMHSAQALWHWA